MVRGGISGSREPSPSVSALSGFDPGRITAGLLGARVDRDKLDLIGPRYITDCRLEEIERRILAIEEREAGRGN
jgi:hypothetical protein